MAKGEKRGQRPITQQQTSPPDVTAGQDTAPILSTPQESETEEQKLEKAKQMGKDDAVRALPAVLSAYEQAKAARARSEGVDFNIQRNIGTYIAIYNKTWVKGSDAANAATKSLVEELRAVLAKEIRKSEDMQTTDESAETKAPEVAVSSEEKDIEITTDVSAAQEAESEAKKTPYTAEKSQWDKTTKNKVKRAVAEVAGEVAGKKGVQEKGTQEPQAQEIRQSLGMLENGQEKGAFEGFEIKIKDGKITVSENWENKRGNTANEVWNTLVKNVSTEFGGKVFVENKKNRHFLQKHLQELKRSILTTPVTLVHDPNNPDAAAKVVATFGGKTFEQTTAPERGGAETSVNLRAVNKLRDRIVSEYTNTIIQALKPRSSEAAAPEAAAPEAAAPEAAAPEAVLPVKISKWNFNQETPKINRGLGTIKIKGSFVTENGITFTFARTKYDLADLAQDAGKKEHEISDIRFIDLAKARLVNERIEKVARKLPTSTAGGETSAKGTEVVGATAQTLYREAIPATSIAVSSKPVAGETAKEVVMVNPPDTIESLNNKVADLQNQLNRVNAQNTDAINRHHFLTSKESSSTLTKDESAELLQHNLDIQQNVYGKRMDSLESEINGITEKINILAAGTQIDERKRAKYEAQLAEAEEKLDVLTVLQKTLTHTYNTVSGKRKADANKHLNKLEREGGELQKAEKEIGRLKKLLSIQPTIERVFDVPESTEEKIREKVATLTQRKRQISEEKERLLLGLDGYNTSLKNDELSNEQRAIVLGFVNDTQTQLTNIEQEADDIGRKLAELESGLEKGIAAPVGETATVPIRPAAATTFASPGTARAEAQTENEQKQECIASIANMIESIEILDNLIKGIKADIRKLPEKTQASLQSNLQLVEKLLKTAKDNSANLASFTLKEPLDTLQNGNSFLTKSFNSLRSAFDDLNKAAYPYPDTQALATGETMLKPVEEHKQNYLDSIASATAYIIDIDEEIAQLKSKIGDDEPELIKGPMGKVGVILNTANNNCKAYARLDIKNQISDLRSAAEIIEKSKAALEQAVVELDKALKIAYASTTQPAIQRMWIIDEDKKDEKVQIPPVAGARAKILKSIKHIGDVRKPPIVGTPPPPPSSPEEPSQTNEQMSAALQILKQAYEKAKKNYNAGLGAVRLFQGLYKEGQEKNKLTEAALETAKKNYETKLAEYTAAYIDGTLRERIDAVSANVKEQKEEKEQKFWSRAVESYKKLGIWRFGISAGLFGVGLWLGVDTRGGRNALDIRRMLGGVAAGFGLYDLLQGGLRLAKEKAGVLRDFTKEQLDEMDVKAVIKHLAARELDAHERNVDIKTDGVYIALLERLQTHQINAIDIKLQDRLDEVDKKFKDLRFSNRFMKVFFGIVSLIFGAATGLGWIFSALHGSYEAAQEVLKGKTPEQVGNYINQLQNIAQHARDVRLNVREAAKIAAQNAADSAHLNTEQTDKLINLASNAAENKAKVIWQGAYKSVTDRGVIDLLSDDSTKLDELPSAAQEAAQTTIQQELNKLATEAKPETGAVSAEAVEKAAFAALKPEQQMEQIQKLITSAADNPQATKEALDIIARNKFANKEFRTLTEAFADARSDYDKIADAVLKGEHPVLENLATQIAGNKPLSLKQFEQLRNLSSWHDTPMGDAAKKLLFFVENPTHNVLSESGIHEIEIDGKTQGHKTLFDAFSEAEIKQGGAPSLEKIDSDFANFLEKYGIDAIGTNNTINEEAVSAAKRISHAGEHLWYSSDDIIASQEHALLSVEFDALGKSEQAPEQARAGGEPPAEQHAKSAAEPRKAPAEKPPKGGPQHQPLDVGLKAPVGTGSIDTDGMRDVLKDVNSLPRITDYVIGTIKQNPGLFLDEKLPALRKSFPALLVPNTRDTLTQALTNERSRENITAIFTALWEKEKKPLVLLGNAFKDGKIEWLPKGK